MFHVENKGFSIANKMDILEQMEVKVAQASAEYKHGVALYLLEF